MTSRLYPVVALHGSAATYMQWNALEARCKQSKRLFYAPSVPGYLPNIGVDHPSSLQIESGSGLDGRVQPLIEFLRSLDQPVHLLGHSFGGLLAMRIAELVPDCIGSLSIYEPPDAAVLTRSKKVFHKQLLNTFHQLGELILNGTPEQAMAFFIDFWMGQGSWAAIPAPAQSRMLDWVKVCARDFQDGFLDAKPRANVTPLNMPFTIYYGELTVEAGKHISQLIAAEHPSAELVEVKGMGHMGPVAQADEFNCIFLDRLSN